jgi:hypothetical protein
MKCYVANGKLKICLLAESHKDAACKSVERWKDKGFKLHHRTIVSEIGFEFDGHESHKDDTIYITSECCN